MISTGVVRWRKLREPPKFFISRPPSPDRKLWAGCMFVSDAADGCFCQHLADVSREVSERELAVLSTTFIRQKKGHESAVGFRTCFVGLIGSLSRVADSLGSLVIASGTGCVGMGLCPV